MEIKNKQPVTREEGQGNNGGKEGEGSSQGTCIKDTRTKPKRVGLRVEGRDGLGGNGGGKMETTVLDQQ